VAFQWRRRPDLRCPPSHTTPTNRLYRRARSIMDSSSCG
jgi:hypothetical protein